MKIYKYTNAQGYSETITGSNKYQKIHYNATDEPFVRYGNIRIKLAEVRGYQDADLSCVIGCEICGVYNDTIYSAYLIHINDSNNRVKVFYSYC